MRTRMFLLSLTATLLLPGCSANHWLGADAKQTRVEVNPLTGTVKFLDSKDNDLEISNFKARVGQNEVTFDQLTLRNNASDPLVADVERIRVIGEAQLSQMEYVKALGPAFFGPGGEAAARIFAPWSMAIRDIAQAAAARAKPAPTSQPS